MNISPRLLNEVKVRAHPWTREPFDDETRKAVTKMLDEESSELIECFYKDLEFGTGGLRGIMGPGTNRVNRYTIGLATQGLGNYLKKSFNPDNGISVAIAYDSRNNSSFFCDI